MRIGKVNRKTNETKIKVELKLDDKGKNKPEISSGIGFFDHMLNLFASHGKFGLKVTCKGDLEVDGHHSVEDIGIALGAALKEALGDKRGFLANGRDACPCELGHKRATVSCLRTRRTCAHDWRL